MPSFQIAGQSLTVPDPDAVASLAGRYRAIYGNISDSRTRLLAVGSASGRAEWTGAAADAFTGLLGQLPGQLDQASRSFTTVADALTRYADGLNGVVIKLGALRSQAEQAESNLATSQAARDQALAAGHDSAGSQARVQDAQAVIDGLNGTVTSLQQEVLALASDCVFRIQQAQAESIPRSLGSFFGSILHDLVDPLLVAAGVETFAGQVLYDAFIKPLVAIPGDCVQLIEHPSFHTLGIALGNVGSSLGIAALVAAALIPGADVVAVPELALYLRGAALSVNVASGVSNTVAVMSHEQGASWTDVAHSALSIGLGRAAGQFSNGTRAMFLATSLGSRITSATIWDGAEHLFGLHSEMPAALATPTDVAALAAPLHAGLGAGSSPSAALNFIGSGDTYSAAVWTVQHVPFTQ